MTELSAATPQSGANNYRVQSNPATRRYPVHPKTTNLIEQSFTAAKDHMLLDRTSRHVLQHTEVSRVGRSLDAVSQPERLAPKKHSHINLTNDYEEDEECTVKEKRKKAEQVQNFNHIAVTPQKARFKK